MHQKRPVGGNMVLFPPTVGQMAMDHYHCCKYSQTKSARKEEILMLKRFFMIKKKYRYIGAAVLLGLVCLALALIFLGGTAPITDTIIVPAGQTTFSIDMDISEAESYAGIEFALTLSDENASEFATFTPSLDGASASPFMSKDGMYYFGFYTLSGSNIFPGSETMVGTLNFTGYTGSEELTVTVVEMNVTRLDEDKKSITTVKDSPSYVFTVARESGGGNGG